jgi:xanthine dehydrogenase accessory factor
MDPALTARAQELTERGEPFANATVVRAQRPTSAGAGDTAIVLADGTIEGFVGGDCAEHSVRAYGVRAIETGEPILLRILPFTDGAQEEITSESGAVTVQNPCLSGGAIEVFLEPVLRAPRLLVEGDTPIARALRTLGAQMDLRVLAIDGEYDVRPGDLAVIAAGHGREELGALRRGLEAGVPYVGLVASRGRGEGVKAELRGEGLPEELVARIETPAGLDVGARTPAEIAVSILARIVEVRRREARPAPAPAATVTAVDPVCGMTVVVTAGTPSLEHGGETVHFCCEGCRGAFERQHA